MGLEFREKVNQIKAAADDFPSALSSAHQVTLHLCLGRQTALPGALVSGAILVACSPPGAQSWSCLWSLGIRVGHIFNS